MSECFIHMKPDIKTRIRSPSCLISCHPGQMKIPEGQGCGSTHASNLLLCLFSSLCSKSWVNIYCVLKEGILTFYKDARNHNTTYNEEPPVDLSTCSFDPSMGYKKKKNVFILQ